MAAQLDEIKALTQLGHALWADRGVAERLTLETFAAVSLLEITEERMLERATMAMLRRAERDGASVNSSALHLPFYRLQPEERLVLSALHVSHWSYERLARTSGKTAHQIAELAWAARLSLASAPGVQVPAPFPAGNRSGEAEGKPCPEYHPLRPWTQAFLDEELPKMERMFIQAHCLECESCGQALKRCRTFYYAADRLVPKPEHSRESLLSFQKAIVQSRAFKDPTRLSFGETIELFSARPGAKLLLIACAIAAAWILRGIFHN